MTVLKMKVDGEWVAVSGPAGPSGQGVPTGGDAGQVLTKLSADDYATEWADPTGGGGTVTDTLWTGPDAPTDPNIELWYDTDAVASGGGGGGFPPVALQPFSVASWTWFNQGTAVITEGGGVVYLTCPAAGNTESLRGKIKPLGALTRVTMAFTGPLFAPITAHVAGLTLHETSTGKFVSFMLESNATGLFVVERRNTTATSGATNVGASQTFKALPPVLFLRLDWTGAAYTWSYSFDGVNFIEHLTEPANTFFTTGPTHVGIAAFNAYPGGLPHGVSFVHWSES